MDAREGSKEKVSIGLVACCYMLLVLMTVAFKSALDYTMSAEDRCTGELIEATCTVKKFEYVKVPLEFAFAAPRMIASDEATAINKKFGTYKKKFLINETFNKTPGVKIGDEITARFIVGGKTGEWYVYTKEYEPGTEPPSLLGNVIDGALVSAVLFALVFCILFLSKLKQKHSTN